MYVEALAVDAVCNCREVEECRTYEVVRGVVYSLVSDAPRALHCPYIGGERACLCLYSSVGIYPCVDVLAVAAVDVPPVYLLFEYKVNVAVPVLAPKEIVPDDSAEHIHVCPAGDAVENGAGDAVQYLLAQVACKVGAVHALYILVEILKYAVHLASGNVLRRICRSYSR